MGWYNDGKTRVFSAQDKLTKPAKEPEQAADAPKPKRKRKAPKK